MCVRVCVCWPVLPKAINQNERVAHSHINRFSLGTHKKIKQGIQFGLMFTCGCLDKQFNLDKQIINKTEPQKPIHLYSSIT